jgi:hypothetical protein
VPGSSLYTHPCLYADPEAIDDLERIPPEWLPRINARRADIERVLRSVGRIQIHHFVPENITPTPSGYELGLVGGTGVMIAPRIVMTNRHVAEQFARRRDSEFPFLKDTMTGDAPVVLIDFGGVYEEQQNLFRVERVLYIAGPDEPDMALLELRETPGRDLPPPVPLQTTEPDLISLRDGQARDAFVAGYPSLDVTRPLRYFRLLRVKRVSLGQISGLRGTRLFHNCTTLGGSSGSPLVDLQTQTIWGLHFQSHRDPAGVEANLAEPMWGITALPAVREALETAGVAAPVAFAAPEAAVMPAPAPAAQASRPVLFVDGDDLDAEQPFPSDWFAAGSAEHQNLRHVLPGVGLVRSQDRKGVTVAAATGFLVGPDLLLTLPLPWQKPLKRNKKQGVFVDFARTVADEPPRRFQAQEELFRDDYLSLLRLTVPEGESLPPPLVLTRTHPDGPALADVRVFAVGHPAAAGVRIGDAAVATRMFPPPYGVKRVALGMLREDDPGEPQIAQGDLWHDCSTTAGDGGAPIVSLASGLILGVHLGGAFQRGNFGMSLWSFLAKPEVQAILR